MPLSGIRRKIKTVIPVGSPLWYFYSLSKRSLQAMRPSSEFQKIRWHVIHQNILLKNLKTIYIPIPKVACSSLKRICAGLLGLPIPINDIAEEIHFLKFPCAKKYKIRTNYKNYFKFAFVRNPWSRLVSCYNDKIAYESGHVYERYNNHFIDYLKTMKVYSENMSFEKFVNVVCNIPDDYAQAHFRSQYSYLVDEKGLIPLEFIGRFEQLSSDFDHLSQKIGVRLELPHIRPGKNHNYRDYYTGNTQKMIAARYEKDIDIFKFTF